MTNTKENLKEMVTNAIKTSDISKDLPSNLLEIIIEFLEIGNIFFCSHEGADIISYNIHGDYMGTIVKAPREGGQQWLTGFDFDSNGALYVAMYQGFLKKYPIKIPENESLYSISIRPREKDKEFEKNINEALTKYEINDEDAATEGVVVIENDKYKSIFVTCMQPGSVLQFSLNGILQRILCQNLMNEWSPWSMKLIPKWFIKSIQSSFIKNKNLLMMAEHATLHIIDIDYGDNGNIMCSLDFPKCPGSAIGDFTFIQAKNDKDKPLLIVNLQKGVIQFHQCEMFWMLKDVNLNEINNNKNFNTLYGTCIGPHGNIYICDHSLNQIIKLKILDYDIIFNQEKINKEIDYDKYIDIEIFAKGMDDPNYAKWIHAKDIGLNFVQFAQDTFKEVQVDPSNESDMDSQHERHSDYD